MRFPQLLFVKSRAINSSEIVSTPIKNKCCQIRTSLRVLYNDFGTNPFLNREIRTIMCFFMKIYEVAKILQTELDYAMNPFRILFSSHKFDLLNCFDEFFSKEIFYKNELAVFSLIKSYFTLYKRCRSDADIKFFSNTIVMYENRKDQVLFLPSMVLQKIDSEINCSRLDSISVTVSENITSKLIASAYRTTWLHTRKDGSPDRRYSDNPKKKIPTAYDLIADISYSCTLKIGPRAWVCYVTGNTVERLISFISSWNKLSTDL